MQRLANPLFLKVFSNGCRRIAFWTVVLVTVAGCALLHPEPKLGAPEVGGFAVKGRMAVRNGEDGFTSSFVWQHATGRDEIDLWGPLGQGHSRLVGEADAVTVYTSKGEVYQERDADAAMQRWLGFSLPMVALTHWIRGEQAPGIRSKAPAPTPRAISRRSINCRGGSSFPVTNRSTAGRVFPRESLRCAAT